MYSNREVFDEKRYLLGALGLVLLGLGTSACSSQTNNSSNKQTATDKSKKSVERPLEIIVRVQNALKRFKYGGTTIRANNISNVTTVKPHGARKFPKIATIT